LEEVIFSVVQVLLGFNPRGVTKSELEESWRARGLPFDLFQRVQSVLEELDRSRYSSTKQSSTDPNSFRERMQTAVEGLLKDAGKARKKGS
jgi:hypothetical protein